MEKMSEAVEEKFAVMMCDFEKILTLIKLFKEMQYEDNNYTKTDLQNMSCILFHQVTLTHERLKEIENLFNQ